MARKYVCLYYSYLGALEPLSDAERGRLLTAILQYGLTGADPKLRGNERFVFAMIKGLMDRDAEAYESACEKKRAGARKSKKSKHMLSDACCTRQEEEKEEEKEDIAFSNSAFSNSAPAPVSLFDDEEDMVQSIANHRRAEQTIRRYGLTDNEVTLSALLEDADKHGWDALEDALRRAAESNTRGGISIRYYRAILTGSGKREEEYDPYAGVQHF